MTRSRKGKSAEAPAAKLSARAVRTGESPISRIMADALAHPDVISLAAGFVDYETLPVEETREAIEDLLSDETTARAALQYGITKGLPALRERLAARLAEADGKVLGTAGYTPENVVIGTGSQQLLYLLSEVLLDPDDIVILGHPSYLVFMDALRSSGVTCRRVPLDDEGMRTDVLRQVFEDLRAEGRLDRVRMIYVVSYFQNPTGLSLSETRRREILDLVETFSTDHRIHVVEDAAYRDLRYEGDDVPSIRSFDEDGDTVVHLRTFSKPFAPGLRTGYGLFPSELAAQVEYLKGAHDFGSANFAQHLYVRILDKGLYDRHVKVLCERYRTRRDVMLEALGKGMPTGVSWTRPHGGLYVWLTLPGSIGTGPDSKLFRAALDRGVAYIPGELCFADCPGGDVPRNCLRLSFGVGTIEKIAEGVRRLAEAVKGCLRDVPAGERDAS